MKGRIFLFVLFGITYGLLAVSATYLHEYAHVRTAQANNISMRIELGSRTVFTAEPVTSGRARFASVADKERFLALPSTSRATIALAGIRCDLWLILGGFVIALSLLIANAFHRLPFWLLVVAMAIGFWALTLLYSTHLNLTTPGGDWSWIW